mmetsp:Transcript_909/g.2778  ORF Transcript_909/g.2778 Transcript_909/m.2778 type:complete len:112 (+) Transcript_909:1406-1741(+)
MQSRAGATQRRSPRPSTFGVIVSPCLLLQATLHKDVEGESGEGSADSELESEVPLKTAPQGQGFLSNILGGDPSPEEVKQRAEDRLENMKSSELDGQQDGSSSGIGSDTLV